MRIFQLYKEAVVATRGEGDEEVGYPRLHPHTFEFSSFPDMSKAPIGYMERDGVDGRIKFQ